MKTIEQLEEALEIARGGGNIGDIEAAVSDLEEARFRELVEAAKCVVATAMGDTFGLSCEDQLQALRLACAELCDALRR